MLGAPEKVAYNFKTLICNSIFFTVLPCKLLFQGYLTNTMYVRKSMVLVGKR